jgi:tyrosine-protein phosphatase SIW14
MLKATLCRGMVTGFALSLSLAGLQAASPSDLPGVHNFHQVNEHVYRGAQPSGQGFAGLAKLGIKTVIDLRGEKSEQKVVEKAGMHYVRLAWSGFKAPADSQVATVLSLLNDNTAWPVFVHCRRGADRTGTAIACYRISHDHWTNQQALEEAKSFGMNPAEIAMRHFIEQFSGEQFDTQQASAPARQASTPIPAAILAPIPAGLP